MVKVWKCSNFCLNGSWFTLITIVLIILFSNNIFAQRYRNISLSIDTLYLSNEDLYLDTISYSQLNETLATDSEREERELIFSLGPIFGAYCTIINNDTIPYIVMADSCFFSISDEFQEYETNFRLELDNIAKKRNSIIFQSTKGDLISVNILPKGELSFTTYNFLLENDDSKKRYGKSYGDYNDVLLLLLPTLKFKYRYDGIQYVDKHSIMKVKKMDLSKYFNMLVL